MNPEAFAQKYRMLRDEVRLVDLGARELKVWLVVLDLTLGEGRHVLRLTQKKDLEMLTGVSSKNLLEPIENLVRMGMLLSWEISTGYVFQVTEPGFWITGQQIDRVLYYRTLSGLRSHNRLADPDPPMPGYAPPKEVPEALGDARNFAPTQGLAEEGKTSDAERPHHQDRGCDQDAGKHQGDKRRESAPENAVQVGAASDNPGAAYLAGVKQDSKAGTSFEPKLWREVERQIESERVLNSSTGRSEGEAAEGERVLKNSTLKGREGPDSAPGVLESSTPSGKVLESSTPPPMHCNNDNGSTSIGISGIAMPVLEATTREEVIEAMSFAATLMKPEEMLHALRVIGAFRRPQGGSYQTGWRKWVREQPRAVRYALIELRHYVIREGRWPNNPGGWLFGYLVDTGAWKGKARP